MGKSKAPDKEVDDVCDKMRLLSIALHSAEKSTVTCKGSLNTKEDDGGGDATDKP